jgi:hypothetical protein
MYRKREAMSNGKRAAKGLAISPSSSPLNFITTLTSKAIK